MKNTISMTLLIIISLLTTNNKAFNQDQEKKRKIVIKTSAQCEMCKERLEKVMAYEKGVISSNLDLNTSHFTVIYKPHKTTPEKLRAIISKTGYDADNVKANPDSYSKLPTCCQKGGHSK